MKVFDEEIDFIVEVGLGIIDEVDEEYDLFVEFRGSKFNFEDGVIVIVVIISCINMLNLLVFVGVGLFVKKVVEKGLICKLWVKILLVFGF